MPRSKAAPQAPTSYGDLVARGVPRERALLGARIARLRWERQWNWQDLATAASVKDVQVKGIETGQREPGFMTLVKLARALELKSLDELLVPAPLE